MTPAQRAATDDWSASLPDILYFGSSSPKDELKNTVFLTPHRGIASLFVIDTGDLFPKGYRTQCNLSYRQWSLPNALLAEPLKKVDVIHNMPVFENVTFRGQSSGYIHAVDVSAVKSKLSLFTSNDPDREVVYTGEEPLPILGMVSHTVEWEFAFDAAQVQKHGTGMAVKIHMDS